MPDAVPMLAYEDGFAALDWLTRAFGFRERTRMTAPDGSLAHGELETGTASSCSRRRHRIIKGRENIARSVSRRECGRRC